MKFDSITKALRLEGNTTTMNTLKMLFAIGCLSLMISTVASRSYAATTYYVSTSGWDGNPGTQAQPFASLTKAVTVINPGDTIDINGGTYNLSSTGGYPVSITRSGTSAAPITIQSTPGQWATINAAGVWASPYDGIDVNANYITIQNLTVENGSTSNVTIDNGSYDTIQYCTFTGGVWDGVTIGGTWVTTENQHDAILGCNVYNNCLVNNNGNGSNWGSAIIVANCQWSNVQNNTVDHNWGEGIGCYSFNNQISANNWVDNNTIYDNWSVEMYIADAQYINVWNNFIYADSSAPLRYGYPAIGIASDNENATYLNKGCEILNNIVIGGMWCFRASNQNSVNGFYAGGLNGFSIYNNVFYNGAVGGVYIDYDPNNSFAFSNNITWETNDNAIVAMNGGGNNGGIWTNCWDGKGSNNMISWGSDLVLPNTNLGFANPGSLNRSGYVLNTNSPCYSSGSNISYLFNFDLNWASRPPSGAWAMGAFVN